jgi:hypothetical protein
LGTAPDLFRNITPATKHIKCHAGPDPASSLFLVPAPAFAGVTRRDGVRIPAFAGMTTLTYIVAGVMMGLSPINPVKTIFAVLDGNGGPKNLLQFAGQAIRKEVRFP